MLTVKYITQDWVTNASAQEVFDYVAKHLLFQNCQSLKDIGCAYFGEWGINQNGYNDSNNLYCAGGCLLKDTEEVRSTVQKYCEERTWEALSNMGFVPLNQIELIDDLRIVHDSCLPKDWFNVLQNVAQKYNLKLDSYVI